MTNSQMEMPAGMRKIPLDPAGLELLRCADEEIRIPGSIQVHGFLLLLDEQAERVVAASENTEEFLGVAARALLGTPIERLLDGEILSGVKAGSSSADRSGPVRYLGAFRILGELFSVMTHRLEGRHVLEFEQLDRMVRPEEVNAEIAHFVERLGVVVSEQELYETITSRIKSLTGFDRVFLYSFDREGHGTVLTEENGGALPSYLDLRFPASDIPPQARALYVSNTMRCIPNASYVPSQLVGMPNVAAARLDLSQSVLRSVSPIHLEYMRNMGTLASMSFSIVLDGQLWGLISAHNSEPRTAPFAIRSVCDLLTKMAATQLKAFRTAAELEVRVQFQAVHSRILAQMAAKNNYVAAMELEMDELMKVTNADGAALLIAGRLGRAGKTPEDADLYRIMEWLDKRPAMELFESRQLGKDFEGADAMAETASGLLAVRISDVKPNYILWFRPEVESTVNWAGEPVKLEDAQHRLHPRASFSIWQETVLGKSLPWTEMEIESARVFRVAILNIFLKRAEEAEHLSEARFEQLTHAIPTLVWTADDEGNLTYVNQRWRDQGFGEQGRWFEVAIAAEADVPICGARWARAILDAVIFEEEVRLGRGEAGGDGRWYLVRAVPFERADGSRAGWLGTCTDLTDRRERELASQMTEKLAITGRMTSVIAHEINNPLEAIMNVMYLLKGITAEDHAAQEYLGMAESELQRISGITKRTLRWNREDVHRAEWTSAGYLFEDAMSLFAGKVRNREVTVEISGGTEVQVYGAVGQLRQVLTNLFSNALDAVPVGGRIRLEGRETGGGSELIVSDAGCGMSPDVQKRIFQPYFSTKGDLGNGLGLYISKEIVETHGGHLLVESEVGAGTTIRVRLPLPRRAT